MKSYKTLTALFFLMQCSLIQCSTSAHADVVSTAQDQCGGNLWVVEISITLVDDYRALISKYACTKGGAFIDGQFYEGGEPAELFENGNVEYSYVGQIIDADNKIVEDHVGAGDALHIDDVPSGFPHLAFVVSRWGASNNYHSYVIYSTFPKLKKITVIERPLSKFQANQRNGRERTVDGFYINKAGDYLIDRLTTKGTDLGTSNASQKWNVETLKLAGDEFISVNIREYHIDTYTRLK